MMTIIEALEDLLVQATKERSHFYVASVTRNAIAEIKRLDFLHKLDHSLADQWQKKNEGLVQTLEWILENFHYTTPAIIIGKIEEAIGKKEQFLEGGQHYDRR